MKKTGLTAGIFLAYGCCSALVAAAPPPSGSPSTVERSDTPAQPPAAEPAASEGEQEVLIRSSAEIGGYGGPDMRMTSILGDLAMLVGAQASWLMNHRYFIGVAGYGLASRHTAPATMLVDGNPSTLGLMYGGLRVGVVTAPTRLVHLTLGGLVGPGNLTGISRVPTRAEFEVGYERRLGHAEMFFVVEPEVAVEANVTTFMRVALAASYRYVTGVEQPGLSSANLSSPTASLALKLGVF